MQGMRRRGVLLAAAAGLALVLASCGAAGSPTTSGQPSSTGSAPARVRTLNPAEQAAADIIRVQSVVPFSPAQIQTLVPMLQALAANPNQTASVLATDGRALQAVLTSMQQEALRNMGSASGPGGFFPGGGPGPAGFRGRRSPSLRAQGSGSGAPSGSGVGRARGPSLIYTLALDRLQGTAPSLPAPGSGTAGAPAGA